MFSGDLGRDDDLLMPPPQRIAHADVLLVESTYGNRVHPREDAQARLGEIIRTTTRAAAACCCRRSRSAARKRCCWCCNA